MRRVFLSLIFFLSACSASADVEPNRAPTQAGSLQIYQSPVPSNTTIPATPAPTQTPLPTATPHLYQVAAGDTIGSISLKFGISMESIITANPDVQPSAMSVGQTLVIPDGEEAPVVLSTPDLPDLELSPPDCYATLSGGKWCFIAVQNNSEWAVENISVEIRLYDEGGNLVKTDVAFSLTDRLDVDSSAALPIFFADAPENLRAEVSLRNALAISDANGRYLPVSLSSVLTEIAWDGRSAKINGDFLVDGVPSLLRVVATAYDEAGKVVGVRRWESASGEKQFSLTVASLGHEIETVELMAEAKP